MRVVLDTNVLVSGLFFGGHPRRVLDAWADGDLEVVVTPSILDEYRRVCDRMREDHPSADFQEVLYRLLAQGSMVADSSEAVAITDDPDDDKFMWCARQSGASVVSGDHHLLDADGWRGVRVMTPRALAAHLGTG